MRMSACVSVTLKDPSSREYVSKFNHSAQSNYYLQRVVELESNAQSANVAAELDQLRQQLAEAEQARAKLAEYVFDPLLLQISKYVQGAVWFPYYNTFAIIMQNIESTHFYLQAILGVCLCRSVGAGAAGQAGRAGGGKQESAARVAREGKHA